MPNNMKLFICASMLMFMISCDKDDFDDKGLILIQPTAVELSNLNLSVGDTLHLEFMYSGNEQILYSHWYGIGEYTFQSSNNLTTKTYWWNNYFPMANNTPYLYTQVVPESWIEYQDDPELIKINKYLTVKMVTDNHTLDYKYALK
jgi:hypothetical protein